MDFSKLEAEYRKQLPALHECAVAIRGNIDEIFTSKSYPRIDKISGRAKKPESFVKKAMRVDEKTDELKYNLPLEEIQDQIGVRVVTFYLGDIDPASEVLLKEFTEVENKRVVPDDPAKFGYEARHIIARIPVGIRKNFNPHIEFFELQICTLFQHAWAEANHDLIYKPDREPSEQEERLLAWAASQAFGADRIFQDLWNRFK